MRRVLCRRLRLIRFAVLGIAVMPTLAFAQQGTQTSLSAQTRDVNGRTTAMLSVRVVGEDSQPVSGPILIEDGRKQVAGAALDGQGNAKIAIDLAAGEHALRAVYAGDSEHQASAAQASVQAQASSTPDFSVAVSPASLPILARRIAGPHYRQREAVPPVSASHAPDTGGPAQRKR